MGDCLSDNMASLGMDKILKLIPKPAINFSYHITDVCNLNCKGCYHFSPLAKGNEFADIDDFERDIERIAFLMHEDVTVVTLFGGEPLLHKEAYKFPYVVKKYLPYSQVDIITNGILIPQMEEEFWKSCEDNDVVIQWTKYPINEELNKKIEDTLVQKGCSFCNFSKETVKTLGHFVIDVEAIGKNGQKQRNDARWQFLNCDKGTNCVQLKNHKLYTCSIAANAHLFVDYFNTGMRLSESDGIDIFKAESKQEIIDFLARPIPFCRYCNVQRQTYGHEFSISTRSIDEWT